MFRTSEEVHTIAKDCGIKLIHVTYPRGFSEIYFDSSKDDSLENYFQLLKDTGKKQCLCRFEPWEPEAYVIDIESIDSSEYSDSIYRKIRNVVEGYNKELLTHEDGEIVSITLYSCIEGILYSIEFTQAWYEVLEEADDALESIISEFDEEVMTWRDQQLSVQKQANKVRTKEFEGMISEDKIFPNIRNKAARMHYIREKAEELGYTEILPISRLELEPFVDLLWSRIKSL